MHVVRLKDQHHLHESIPHTIAEPRLNLWVPLMFQSSFVQFSLSLTRAKYDSLCLLFRADFFVGTRDLKFIRQGCMKSGQRNLLAKTQKMTMLSPNWINRSTTNACLNRVQINLIRKPFSPSQNFRKSGLCLLKSFISWLYSWFRKVKISGDLSKVTLIYKSAG